VSFPEQRNIFLNGTSFKNELYSPIPNKDAIDVTSVTRPRNSGENPSLFVLKYIRK
jgi:hypothetical protein